MDTLNDKVRGTLLKSLEEFLADGRQELAPVFTAIGPDKVIAIILYKIADTPEYLALIDQLAKADREADALLALIALAKEALAAALAAGLFGA